MLGGFRLKRPYYHCADCHTGFWPGDELLGVAGQTLSVAAAEVVSLAGTLSSFAQAAERTLRKLSGLRVSESTVERTTEETGQQVAEWLPEEPRQARRSRHWRWQRDAEGKRCAYVSLDHTGVRRQGPGASKVEGRMAAVGMIYNPASEHDRSPPSAPQVRYVAGFYSLEAIGPRLFAQALEVGGATADCWIALTDGGNGLESVLQRHFPCLTCILDFWHASEYVAELARAVHGDDEEAFGQLNHRWCHQMKHEGGAALLAELQSWQPQKWTPTIREAYETLTRYIGNNVHRMDYPTYLARGWQIGSGPVEAACKTVINQRLNASGMRWGDDGANAVSNLRALYLSEPSQWDRFWKRLTTQYLQN